MSNATNTTQRARGRKKRILLMVGAGIALSMLISLLAIGMFLDPSERPSPLIGKKAPPFVLTNIHNGTVLSSADLAGRPYVINFWASWCLPCQEEAPILQALYERHELQLSQLRMIGIASQTTLEGAKEFSAQFNQTYFSGLDDAEGSIVTNYGLFGFPETFFVSSEGIIVAKHTGAVSADEMEHYLNELLP